MTYGPIPPKIHGSRPAVLVDEGWLQWASAELQTPRASTDHANPEKDVSWYQAELAGCRAEIERLRDQIREAAGHGISAGAHEVLFADATHDALTRRSRGTDPRFQA